ncbi:MAG: hypothetical protein QJR13_08235 [Bacillota bacterium]|nr:hypothetical protein [Bacillota bacterium]
MAVLSEPSRELALKLLREVEYEERLVGYKMSPATGNEQCSLYSLQEVADFLRMDSLEHYLLKGGHPFIGYIDLEELTRWVGEVLGDQELARALEEELKQGESYQSKVALVKPLLKQRLEQCRALAEALTNGSAEAARQEEAQQA